MQRDFHYTKMTLAAYAAHFWLNVRPVENGCWEWDGIGHHKQGYGEFSTHPEVGERKAHRIAWALAVGPIPEGQVVRHECDNTACCNIHHLRLGTQSDNMEDMRLRGRAFSGRGERANAAKLTDDDVRDMFHRRSLGETFTSIAKDYGVTKTRVWQIVTKEGWAFSA